MFILDRPLDPNYKVGRVGCVQCESELLLDSLPLILQPTAPHHSGGKVSDMLRPRRTFAEYRELLWSFSNHLEVSACGNKYTHTHTHIRATLKISSR